MCAKRHASLWGSGLRIEPFHTTGRVEVVVRLDRILHSPLCLPIRDRDKYNTHNKHISDKHTLMTICVRSGTPFDGVHAPQSLRFGLVVHAAADPI
jgi:hypothetical protein